MHVLAYAVLVLFVVFVLEIVDSLAEYVTVVAQADFGVYVEALAVAGAVALAPHGAGQAILKIQQELTNIDLTCLSFSKTALLA